MTTCIKVTCHFPALLLTWPLLTTILVQFTECSTPCFVSVTRKGTHPRSFGTTLHLGQNCTILCQAGWIGGCPRYIGRKLSPCSPSPVLLQKLDVRCAPSVERHGRATQVIVDDNVFWGDAEQRHRQGFLLFWLFPPSNILKTPLAKGAATQTESVSIR